MISRGKRPTIHHKERVRHRASVFITLLSWHTWQYIEAEGGECSVSARDVPSCPGSRRKRACIVGSSSIRRRRMSALYHGSMTSNGRRGASERLLTRTLATAPESSTQMVGVELSRIASADIYLHTITTFTVVKYKHKQPKNHRIPQQ